MVVVIGNIHSSMNQSHETGNVQELYSVHCEFCGVNPKGYLVNSLSDLDFEV